MQFNEQGLIDQMKGMLRLERSLEVQESELETVRESLKGMRVD